MALIPCSTISSTEMTTQAQCELGLQLPFPVQKPKLMLTEKRVSFSFSPIILTLAASSSRIRVLGTAAQPNDLPGDPPRWFGRIQRYISESS